MISISNNICGMCKYDVFPSGVEKAKTDAENLIFWCGHTMHVGCWYNLQLTKIKNKCAECVFNGKPGNIDLKAIPPEPLSSKLVRAYEFGKDNAADVLTPLFEKVANVVIGSYNLNEFIGLIDLNNDYASAGVILGGIGAFFVGKGVIPFGMAGGALISTVVHDQIKNGFFAGLYTALKGGASFGGSLTILNLANLTQDKFNAIGIGLTAGIFFATIGFTGYLGYSYPLATTITHLANFVFALFAPSTANFGALILTKISSEAFGSLLGRLKPFQIAAGQYTKACAFIDHSRTRFGLA